MIVGMDFGTTNSGMSCYDGRQLRLIPLDHANANPHVARTALYITNRRRVYMGREAVDKYYEQNINRKVRYQRMYVGEISLEFAEVQTLIQDVTIEKDVLSPGRLFLSFKTGLRSPSYLGTVVGAQFYLLEDIVALYLYTTRLRAEAYLGTELRQIVLGRPVHFAHTPEGDHLAEQRLVHAAFLAGYDEVYLQYEPIAAAHFYETSLDRPENVLIFDFGGGTLDITIARLGDPAEREILATGGVPVAGDVFDQKLVRANLPRYFGEGSTYRGDTGTIMPVPMNFFEAFGDWQELLELNKPDFMRMLDVIGETAQRGQQITMLRNLIASSYSLKMYDAVEAAKRTLSDKIIAKIDLDGPGFRVQHPVTRLEFGALIEDDVAVVAELIDDVVARAGLRHNQIDAVIRTGGSAQIPAFIELLDQRFGREKVREIDTFSSVTSGLGILGHHVELGQAERVDLRHYRRDEWADAAYGSRVRQDARSGAPKVDLDLMMQFIDIEEQETTTAEDELCLLAISAESDVLAATEPAQRFADAAAAGEDLQLADVGIVALGAGVTVAAVPPDARVLLMTSEYRFLVRTVQDVADLAAVGMNLAELESLTVDKFGREMVRGINPWHSLQGAERLMLVGGQGTAKVMYGEALLENLDQLYPYQLEHLGGEPVALVPVDDGEIVFVTNAGSVARLDPQNLITGKQRVLRLRKDERIVAAFNMARPGDILLAEASGKGKRVNMRSVQFTNGADLGTKTLTRRALCAAVPLPRDGVVWAVTSERLIPLNVADIPLDALTPASSRTLTRLNKHEILLALQFLS